MHFSTLFTTAAAFAGAVTGMAIKERNDVVSSKEATHELLRAYKTFEQGEGVQARCAWKTCDICFDRYPYCNGRNPLDIVNCIATCSQCPGNC
ncbi:hypothetical protein FDECE_18402 [Fusarium decemcellulare]|nr:hypothetical protein FDECE_18402 [Fusarium decemcellulare]